MNSKKFNMSHLPSEDKRPLVGEYKKTIVTLIGHCNTGKSTLMELLMNDNFNYISIDRVCQETNLDEISTFINSMNEQGIDIRYDLGRLFRFIADNCPSQFIDYFFTKYIKDNENLNIFVEGYVFMITDLYRMFIAKCKENDYRIWEIRRVL